MQTLVFFVFERLKHKEKSYSVFFFVFEQFAVQTVAINKNLIQYVFAFKWFAVKITAIKKNLIQYFLVFELFAVQTINN